jgi:hypothetical protein
LKTKIFSKKNIINILLFIFASAIIAFGVVHLTKPRIDISTDEKMKESTERLRDSLNDDQKTKFEQAVRYIAFDGLTFDDIMSADETIKKIKEKFKNKSYDDIVYDARKIVKREIKNLNSQRASSESARKSLEDIVVERTTMNTDNSGFMPKRILYMMVKNNIGRTLSTIAFNIKTFAPGREVPYLNDDFKYEIPGGIQNGETLEWKLEPNTFLNNEWNRDVPNGIIQIKAIACTDSNETIIFQDTWTVEKDKLMQTLKEFMKD